MKKLISCILALALLLPLISASAQAFAAPLSTPIPIFGGPLNVPNASPARWRLYSDGNLFITPAVDGQLGVIERGTATTSAWWHVPTEDIPIERIVFNAPVVGDVSLRALFADTTTATEIVGLQYLDVSTVTTMRYMFRNVSNVTSLDLSAWDTRNVVDMTAMFSGMTALRELTLGANFHFADNAGLPEPLSVSPFTGRWTNGGIAVTSAELMTLSNPTGTWVWQHGTTDRTALQAAITVAGQHIEISYTPGSWADFMTALSHAQAVLDDLDASQTVIDTAAETLTVAKNNLTAPADRTALQAAVNAAEQRIERDYVHLSWLAFVPVLNESRAVLDDHNATQAEVDTATQALNNALATLVLRTDFTALQRAISNANVLQESHFTAVTWAPFAQALQAARDVWLNINASQQEVDDALYVLQTAQANLTENPLINHWTLYLFVQQVEDLHPRAFTQESWVVFPPVLAHAQAVLTAHQGGNATQEQIDAAYAALRHAHSSLVTMVSTWNPFTDIHRGQWFYYDVRLAYLNQIMLGTSPTVFQPNLSMSRAQVAVMLHRIMDNPTPQSSEIPFTDVAADRWHTDAILWAAENNLMRGVGYVAPSPGADSSDILGPAARWFDPHREIMRVEMAIFMHRLVEFLGYDTTVRQSERWSNYEDIHLLHSWGIDAMMWAEYHNLLPMRADNLLSPREPARRYETAVMLARFWDSFGW